MTRDHGLWPIARAHARPALITCELCSGTGSAWIPRTWGNDPEGRVATCPDCEGSGEVEAELNDGAHL